MSTRLSIKSLAHVFSLSVEGLEGFDTVTFTNNHVGDKKIEMRLPKALFPMCQVGEVVYITLGATRVAVEDDEPVVQGTGLIIPGKRAN